MFANLPYLNGQISPQPDPLARYLPPIPEGVATQLLAKHAHPGDWVLDPFGASPRMALELAQAGYRVLVLASNPVARFLIEMAANPPPASELRAALAELSTAPKGDERIEPHIRSLYNTTCSTCEQPIMAEAFLWVREASAPYGAIYQCPKCDHESTEHPASPADADHVAHLHTAGLHKLRALERVAPLDDPDRHHAEEALSVYLPRAVYALFTLINKLDGLTLPPLRHRCLVALLLYACDQANTLWAYPTTRERPRQLGIPPRFRENNVWLALEKGIDLWASFGKQVPLTLWPAQPPASGGIGLFEGRLRDWEATLPPTDIRAVVTALPRPNQAFWTLSALWTGWLWGREAMGPFKTVLRRHRYDWAWHTAALSATLSHLNTHISSGTPLVGIIGETETGFLKAAAIAADGGRFNLKGMALRDEHHPVYLTWQCAGEDATLLQEPANLKALAQQAITSYLDERGEPVDYLHVVAATMTGLVNAHAYRRKPPPITEKEEQPAEYFSHTESAIRELLSYRGAFLHHGTAEAIETGLWGLRQYRMRSPLPDRVEIALVNYLVQHTACTFAELDDYLCDTFRGLFTPDHELLHVILDSYAEQDPPESGNWRLRVQDSPAARQADLEEVRGQLRTLGERLGYLVEGAEPGAVNSLVWRDADRLPQYWFHPKASAVFGEIVQSGETPAQRTLIVLPGGRANLAAYKQRRDPHLKLVIDEGWRFLKFRHLRWLLDSPILSRDFLEDQFNADPLTYTAPQMRLF